MGRMHRLSSPHDFQRVLRRGSRAHADAATCVVARSDADAPVRVGVTASRRIGGAVQRNRAKRRLRAVAGAHLNAVGPGKDLILIAKPAVLTLPFQELVDDVGAAVVKASGRC